MAQFFALLSLHTSGERQACLIINSPRNKCLTWFGSCWMLPFCIQWLVFFLVGWSCFYKYQKSWAMFTCYWVDLDEDCSERSPSWCASKLLDKLLRRLFSHPKFTFSPLGSINFWRMRKWLSISGLFKTTLKMFRPDTTMLQLSKTRGFSGCVMVTSVDSCQTPFGTQVVVCHVSTRCT